MVRALRKAGYLGKGRQGMYYMTVRMEVGTEKAGMQSGARRADAMVPAKGPTEWWPSFSPSGFLLLIMIITT